MILQTMLPAVIHAASVPVADVDTINFSAPVRHLQEAFTGAAVPDQPRLGNRQATAAHLFGEMTRWRLPLFNSTDPLRIQEENESVLPAPAPVTLASAPYLAKDNTFGLGTWLLVGAGVAGGSALGAIGHSLWFRKRELPHYNDKILRHFLARIEAHPGNNSPVGASLSHLVQKEFAKVSSLKLTRSRIEALEKLINSVLNILSSQDNFAALCAKARTALGGHVIKPFQDKVESEMNDVRLTLQSPQSDHTEKHRKVKAAWEIIRSQYYLLQEIVRKKEESDAAAQREYDLTHPRGMQC